MTCIFTAQAKSDLEMIGDYIALDNPKRAVTFIQEIRQSCTNIMNTPFGYPLAPEYGKDIRRLPHGNYLILYRVSGDDVVIIHIVHAARQIRALRTD